MEKFKIKQMDTGVSIIHNAYPECEIEVIILEVESLYEGGLNSVFDFFIYNNNKTNEKFLYQFLVTDFYEDGHDEDNIEPSEYRKMLNKAWKWYLFGFLLPLENLTFTPRFIGHEDEESNGQFAEKFSVIELKN